MSADDVTDAPWAVVVDGDRDYIVIDDDDPQPTVCDIPAMEQGRHRPLLVEDGAE